MDSDKRVYEAFGHRKFAQPHPALYNNNGFDSGDGDAIRADDDYVEDENEVSEVRVALNNKQKDEEHVILHFDCDCFYAQVEEVRNPALRQVPLGVTQKYLIVTCNYLARAAGVTKLMGIRDAMARCPGLVLVSGEDLGPYRQASKSIHAVLSRYGPAEKLGMDETFVDVTEEVLRRIRSGAYEPPAPPPRLVGHLHTATCAVAADTAHRPQDLRAVPAAGPAVTAAAVTAGQCFPGVVGVAAPAADAGIDGSCSWAGSGDGRSTAGESGGGGGGGPARRWELLLTVGSIVAAEARAAVRSETGVRSSAGISSNKMLAKLVSGLHKPDDQTVLLPDQAWGFVAPLPLRALPGVGFKTERQLADELGAATAGDVRRYSLRALTDKLGEKTGTLLWHLCRGLDPAPVRSTGPPRSISVEDSFRGCGSWSAAAAVLRVLAPDLLQRLYEEYDENRRRPDTLTLRWRLRGSGWSRSSASCAMPLPAGALAAPPSPAQVDLLVRSALQVLQKQLREPFNLVLLNLGATNFKQDDGAAGTAGGGSYGGGTIVDLFNQRSGRQAAPAAGRASAAVAVAVAVAGLRNGGGAAAAAAASTLVCGAGKGLEVEGVDEEEEEEGLGDAGSPMDWMGGAAEGRYHDAGATDVGRCGVPAAAMAGEASGAGGLSPQEARRAAERSAAFRRDYRGSGAAPGSGPAVPALLSKSRERQLREAAAAGLNSRPSASPLPPLPLGSPPGGAPLCAVAGGGTGGVTAVGLSPVPLPLQLSQPQPQPRPQPPVQQPVQPPLQPPPSPWGAVRGPQRQPVAGEHGRGEGVAEKDEESGGFGEPGASSPSPRPPPAKRARILLGSQLQRGAGRGGRDTPTEGGAAVPGVPHGGPKPCTEVLTFAATGAGPGLFLGLDPDDCAAGVSSRLDAAVVGYRVVELYDDIVISEDEHEEAEEKREEEYGGDEGASASGSPRASGGSCCYSGNSSSSDGGGIWSLPGGWDGWEAVYPHRSGVVHAGTVSEPAPRGGSGPAAAAAAGCVPSTSGFGPGPPPPPPPPPAAAAGLEHRVAGGVGNGGGDGGARSANEIAVGDNGHDGSIGAGTEGAPDQRSGGAGLQRQQQQQCHQDERRIPADQAVAPLQPPPSPPQPVRQQPSFPLSPRPLHGPPQPQPQPQPPRLRAPQRSFPMPGDRRVFLHVDVDCFYCQVERLDEPSLVGLPLAVTQFNSGGFVAVSYEARAAGIRCGDGVGAGGRASIPHLKAMGAVSLEEAQRRCPGLVVRPMRTERYRRVADSVHVLLRRFAPDGQVEKASYDDFYLDVTAACCSPLGGGDDDRRYAHELPTTAACISGGGAFVGAAAGGEALGPPAPRPGGGGDGGTDGSGGLGLNADWAEYNGTESYEYDDTEVEAKGEELYDPDMGDLDPDRASLNVEEYEPPPSSPGDQHQPQQQPQQEPQSDSDGPPPPHRVHVAGGGRWGDLEPWLRRGVAVAQQIRSALQEALSFSVSVGVAPTKLSARLAGPANKPDAITVVPAARVRQFMSGVRLRSVPTLAGKTGASVVSELGVESVGQLTAWSRQDLINLFGPQLGNLLADLPYGGACGAAVRERGPRKSILVERSFPAINRFSGVKEALVPMVGALWERVVEDSVVHRRSPAKLLLTWRQGYGATKTRSADVTVQLLQALKAAAAAGVTAAPGPAASGSSPATATDSNGGVAAAAASSAPPTPAAVPGAAVPGASAANETVLPGGPVPSAAASGRWMEPGAVPSHTYQGCRALLEGFAAIFKQQGLGTSRASLQITRLAVAVGFGASDGSTHVATAVGQRPISAFTVTNTVQHPEKPLHPHAQQQHHYQHPGGDAGACGAAIAPSLAAGSSATAAGPLAAAPGTAAVAAMEPTAAVIGTSSRSKARPLPPQQPPSAAAPAARGAPEPASAAAYDPGPNPGARGPGEDGGHPGERWRGGRGGGDIHWSGGVRSEPAGEEKEAATEEDWDFSFVE